MSSAHSIELPNIRIGVTHVQHGGLLIYPTETAYALGCDATNARAVRAIFRLKGRERGKPLPLIVASRAMAERYARFTPLARQLAKRWWPGPLTVVAASAKLQVPTLRSGPRHEVVGAASWPTPTFSPPPVGRGSVRGWGQLAPGILAPNGTIALRVSSHPIARALSQRLGRPIVSTSANHSGQPPCYTVRSALRSLGYGAGGKTSGVDRKTPDVEEPAPMLRSLKQMLVLDIGPLPPRRPSTIVDARGDRPVVLRKGSIVV